MCGDCGCETKVGQSGMLMPAQGWVDLGVSLLDANRRVAQSSRSLLLQCGAFAVNLMSSPGAGKTSWLVATLASLDKPDSMAVIEADQQTDLDAQRIRATGVRAHQINTGQRCHLDAQDILNCAPTLLDKHTRWLFIENIGNLICPSSFDLGEAKRVVLYAVTEGEEKPLKYPDMFAAADVVILTKMDLAAAVGFDQQACVSNIAKVSGTVPVIPCSARTGMGVPAWLDWLRNERQAYLRAQATL